MHRATDYGEMQLDPIRCHELPSIMHVIQAHDFFTFGSIRSNTPTARTTCLVARTYFCVHDCLCTLWQPLSLTLTSVHLKCELLVCRHVDRVLSFGAKLITGAG